jgi:hypothetical protein
MKQLTPNIAILVLLACSVAVVTTTFASTPLLRWHVPAFWERIMVSISARATMAA